MAPPALQHTPRPSSNAQDRDRLIVDHACYVPAIASRIARTLPHSIAQDRSDLVGAGLLGLVHAAQDFNPARGSRFRSYAEHRVRGFILDSLRARDTIPRPVRVKWKAVRSAHLTLEQQLMRKATLDEVATATHQPRPALDRILLSNPIPIPIDTAINVSAGGGGPLDIAMRHETESLVARALAHLPKRERLVLLLYYFDEMGMPEIGRILGIGCSAVSQIHTKAIKRLRTHYLVGSL